MCKGLILSMWVILNISNLSAQMLTSAKIKGLGNIISTTPNVGNVGLNPSLMDSTHQISFQFNVQNSLFNQHLKYISGGITGNRRTHAGNLEFGQGGISSYKYQHLAISRSQEFGKKLLLGHRITYQKQFISNYQTESNLKNEVGFLYKGYDNIHIGGYVKNLALGKEWSKILPAYILGLKGFSSPTSHFMLESHFENEVLYWRIALALKLHRNFSIYYGNQILEFQHAAGIGFQFNKGEMEFSFIELKYYLPQTQISINYHF